MLYSIRSLSDGEVTDSLAAHVMARAYRTAWRVRHGEDPVGLHPITGLDLIIDYRGVTETRRSSRAKRARKSR